MPFQLFNDSRGKKHLIYIQEKQFSCGLASVCTLLKSFKNIETEDSTARFLREVASRDL
ncbi:MAG: hypothetical protein ACD_46C00201G0001, partial [uncultured bacterium]